MGFQLRELNFWVANEQLRNFLGTLFGDPVFARLPNRKRVFKTFLMFFLTKKKAAKLVPYSGNLFFGGRPKKNYGALGLFFGDPEKSLEPNRIRIERDVFWGPGKLQKSRLYCDFLKY